MDLFDRGKAWVRTIEPVTVSATEALALIAVITASLSVTAAVWWRTGNSVSTPLTNQESPASIPPPTFSSSPDTTENVGQETITSQALPEHVVVHIAGEVNDPGVVELLGGSRVRDAVSAGGGPTPSANLTAVNLARLVSDGEQIMIPAVGDPVDAGSETEAGPPLTSDGLLDVNAATVEQLQSLPGIGPVTAQRIVAHREQIGRFDTVTQLLDVSGIGPARFNDLQNILGVTP